MQKLLAEFTMIVSFGVGTHNHPLSTLKASVTIGVNVPAPSVPVEIPSADLPAAIVAAPVICEAESLDLVACGVVEVIVLWYALALKPSCIRCCALVELPYWLHQARMISIVWPAAGMIITSEPGLDDMIVIVP
jgi:hypothetical protein